MSILSKRLLAAATAAAFSLGTSATVQAATFASAILDINNFQFLHSNGIAYSATDFAALTGTNDAHATASLNGVFANGAQSFPILSGSNPNVAHQCVGAPCPARPEDNFVPFGGPPGATFGYADQALAGSSISVGGAAAGAHAQTRADAATAANAISSGNSDVGTSTTFQFVLGLADTITVSFDGTPYTQAFVSGGAGPTSNANARLSWSINIIDLSTNTSVFDFAPAALNGLSAVSRTDGLSGTTTYAPGTAAYSSITPLLVAGTSYQITIQHNTLANALQEEVPEPDTLAVMAAGLLGMTWLSRRRKS
jgi:hypothetical protein